MANSAAHDVGAGLVARPAAASISVTAAGSGDSTTAVGYAVDTSPQTLGARFNSAALLLSSIATMASGESISVVAGVDHSTNNSDWTVLVTAAAVYVHTATGGAASLVQRSGRVSVDLSKAKQWIRATLNPDMSRTGTDTAVVSAVWALGHPDRIPSAA
jgi:hypothetical protein